MDIHALTPRLNSAQQQGHAHFSPDVGGIIASCCVHRSLYYIHGVHAGGVKVTARMAAGRESKLQLVHRHIRAFSDFPKKGILFRWENKFTFVKASSALKVPFYDRLFQATHLLS